MRFLLSFLLLLNVIAAAARVTIKDVITTIPEDVVPYIQAEQRAEIHNFLKSKDTLTVKNALEGNTSVEVTGNDYALIRLNKITDLHIKLLPVNDSTSIICIVKTINRPVKESTVNFYTEEWDEIKKDFDLPQAEDAGALLALFTQRPADMSEKTYAELTSYIDPVMINIEVSETENILKYNLSLPFVDNDVKTKVNAIIKQNTFKWNGDRFKKC